MVVVDPVHAREKRRPSARRRRHPGDARGTAAARVRRDAKHSGGRGAERPDQFDSLDDAREAARTDSRPGTDRGRRQRRPREPATRSSTCSSTANSLIEFRTPRIVTRNTHGTGCTFASAIAAHLALGHSLAEATERAQAYVAGAIRHALADRPRATDRSITSGTSRTQARPLRCPSASGCKP